MHPPTATDSSRVRLTLAQVELARALGIPAAFRNPAGMDFVLVPPGTFAMGSPPTEPDRHQSERRHAVTLTRPYYLQRTPVTRGDLRRIEARERGTALDAAVDDARPLTGLGHAAAVALAARVSALDPRRDYRLPTEAEWEHACRAGTETRYAGGDELTPAQACCRWPGAEPEGPSDVGRYPPNRWGLLDMHGNVQEWCGDWFASFSSRAQTDPTGPAVPELFPLHVVKGGSWRLAPHHCRSASRMGSLEGEERGCDAVGLRLASVPPPTTPPR